MGAWPAQISCTTLKPWASTPAPLAMGQWMLPPTQVGAFLVSDRSGSLLQHRQLITMTSSMSLRQQTAAPTCQHRAPLKLLLCVLGLAPVTSHSQAPALSSWCTSVSCLSQGQPSTRCFLCCHGLMRQLACRLCAWPPPRDLPPQVQAPAAHRQRRDQEADSDTRGNRVPGKCSALACLLKSMCDFALSVMGVQALGRRL